MGNSVAINLIANGQKTYILISDDGGKEACIFFAILFLDIFTVRLNKRAVFAYINN